MKRMSAVIILLLGFLGIAFFTENGGVVKQRVPNCLLYTSYAQTSEDMANYQKK